MNNKRILFVIFLILAAALALSGCTGSAYQATSWAGLTVDQDVAYLANNSYVFAVNLTDHSEIWRYPNGAPDPKKAFYAQPVLTPDGQLIVGGFDHILYSLDPNTGNVNWTFEQAKDRYIGAALVTDQAIYAPNADGALYALDFKGGLLWKFQNKEPLWAQPATDSSCECIYLPSMDHVLYSLNSTNGGIIWKTEDLGGALVGTPTLDGQDVLYVGTFGNDVLAINRQDGSVLWRTPTNFWVWSGPTLVDGVLYFGDLKGNFYAVNATDGSIVWQKDIGQAIVSRPTVDGDQIFLAVDGDSIYTLQTANGNFNAPVVPFAKAKILSTPQISNDKILIAPIGSDAVLAALNQNGSISWSFVPEKKK